MPPFNPSHLQHVTYSWNDAEADRLSPLGRLVYRSNLLGSDQRITNTGGGNTSAKLEEIDPLSGNPAEVLWVKGSGGDLRTVTRANFSSLYQDKLLALRGLYARTPERGVKTPAEDAMVGRYLHCTYNLNPCVPSIDTPLHSFIPAAHVDHTHPNAVIAIAASKHAKELTTEVFGDEVAWTAWKRPGFELGLTLREACESNPRLKGIVLGQHGLINWSEDDHGCYALSLELIEKASRFIASKDRGERTFGGARFSTPSEDVRRSVLLELVPWLRGKLAGQKRSFATVQATPEVLRFVNSVDAARLAELGTSCPDHFLRTKIKPMFVAWDPQTEDTATLRTRLESGLEQYRRDYRAYYEKCKRADSPAMRDANPTVVLVPGLGIIAWGKSKSESRVTAEFYTCAVDVMRGAEAIDEYVALPQQEAFDIEYWLLEEAKLQRMPAEKELARTIAVVVGAGHGIGKATAHRLARDGAHVVCADLSADAAKATAKELTDIYGLGIGVAGSGISGCGMALGVGVDMTSRESLRELFAASTLAFGGLDSLIVTAGVYVPPKPDGSLTEAQWKFTFDVNVMGLYLAADESRAIWKRQCLAGSIVLTTSVNGVVSKKGSLAYDTSKAAADHLMRELAVEFAPLVRVNAVAPATVVEGSTMFPRDRVIASLTKYKLAFSETETDDSLRSKLAGFYAERTMLKIPITPAHQAEAICFLAGDRSSRTTGQILNVDAGLHEAFLR